MVALMQTRDWRLKPGQSRRVQCVNDDEFFTIEVTAIAEEQVKTPTGTFDSVVLEPNPSARPSASSRKAARSRLRISKGDRPQIVRSDTKLKFGTITAVLTKEETFPPPAATQPTTNTAAPEQQPAPVPAPQPVQPAPAASAP